MEMKPKTSVERLGAQRKRSEAGSSGVTKFFHNREVKKMEKGSETLFRPLFPTWTNAKADREITPGTRGGVAAPAFVLCFASGGQ